MAKRLKRAKLIGLTDRGVKAVGPGTHACGDGLYLDVIPSGARSWLFRYARGGKSHWMGLGSYPAFTLAEARAKALEAHRLHHRGIDPLEAKRKAQVVVPTFGQIADEVAASLSGGWRNEKHRKQWVTTLTVDAAPLRDIPVNQIDTGAVLKVLAPLWSTKRETASRLRGRIETVLDAARAKGLRAGPNPAEWKGNLKSLLAPALKVAQDHHPALPYAEVPELITRLRESPSVAALALEFTIITAACTNEVLGAKWDEINIETAVWTIPKGRTKAGKEDRVPLSGRAIAILNELGDAKSSDHVFASYGSRPVGPDAMRKLLRRLGVKEATPHGFRSSFRDWAGNETHAAREIIEHCLAHREGSAAERAYWRADAIEKRRLLMQAWANFCEPRAMDNVVTMRRPA
jgi:integrase